MIAGSIHQRQVVEFLSQSAVLRRCFDWIQRAEGQFTDGITELEGTDLFVNVHGYATKPRRECRWESHRHTADLQFCISGAELIDWSLHAPRVGNGEPYDATKDFEFWRDEPPGWDTLGMGPGCFAFFLPGELHRPAIRDARHAAVRKLVFKIREPLLGIR